MNLRVYFQKVDRLEREVAELRRMLEAARPGEAVPVPAAISSEQASAIAADVAARRARRG